VGNKAEKNGESSTNQADNKVNLSLGLKYLETDQKTNLGLAGDNLDATQKLTPKHVETNPETDLETNRKLTRKPDPKLTQVDSNPDICGN
jgi:hypothetical protein